MTLLDWLKENGTTQTELAEAIGKTQGYVAQIVKSGTASLDVALAIHDFTSGKVEVRTLQKGVAA